MRLFELTQRVKLYATKRYLKNAAFYARGYPAFSSALRAFLTAKMTNPLVPTGKKDEPFTGVGGMKESGAWHAHMVHGKVVLIYKSTAASLTLYDVVEHNAFEGKAQESLASYIASAAVEPLSPPVERRAITDAQLQSFNDLLGYMAEQDRDILDAAVRGDFNGLIEFVTLVPLPWEALVERMGGKTAMRKHIKSRL